MIDRRAKVLAKGKEVLEEAEGLGGEIDMDDLDQSMTLGDFQAFLKERTETARSCQAAGRAWRRRQGVG